MNDPKVEVDETFTVDLNTVSGATVSDGSGEGTITNDDSTTISIDDVAIVEGVSGTANLVFTVSLSAESYQDVSVNYTTVDGTATVADGDYIATSGSLTITAGKMSETITVPVSGDHRIETDETFTVDLSIPVNATISDASGQGTITNDDLATGQIDDRHIFYNGSALDGGNLAADEADDAAIAADKDPLFLGEDATFANYTSYLGGITGIMVDIQGIGDPTEIDPSDFILTVGNVDDITTWSAAPSPTEIAVRAVDENDDTVTDFHRVTLTFDEGSIVGQWLSVTVLANTDTGIPVDDTFFFGNAPCETGDSETDAHVTPTDAANLRAESAVYNWRNEADVTVVYDFNRDGRVNAFDSVKVRHHYTDVGNALNLISPTIPAPVPLLPPAPLVPPIEELIVPQTTESVELASSFSTLDDAANGSAPTGQLASNDGATTVDQALQGLLLEDELPTQDADQLLLEDSLLESLDEYANDEADLADEVFALIGEG